MSKVQSHQRAKIFQVLAHPIRLQILETLASGPACVCDLVETTHKRQPYISQQLAILREAELVSTERDGWKIFYSINEEQIEMMTHILESLQTITQHWKKKTQGKKTMSKENNQSWHGIPRSEIDWQPMIVGERCIGCGMCATSCGRGVYAFDYEQNQPVVVAPEMCMVGCTTCATLCTQDAIEFPSTGYIRQLIRQKKLLRQSKDILRDNREKYDLKVRGVGSI